MCPCMCDAFGRRRYEQNRGLLPELVGMTPPRCALYAGYDIRQDFLTKSTSLQEHWVVSLAGVCLSWAMAAASQGSRDVCIGGVRGVASLACNVSRETQEVHPGYDV